MMTNAREIRCNQFAKQNTEKTNPFPCRFSVFPFSPRPFSPSFPFPIRLIVALLITFKHFDYIPHTPSSTSFSSSFVPPLLIRAVMSIFASHSTRNFFRGIKTLSNPTPTHFWARCCCCYCHTLITNIHFSLPA